MLHFTVEIIIALQYDYVNSKVKKSVQVFKKSYFVRLRGYKSDFTFSFTFE